MEIAVIPDYPVNVSCLVMMMLQKNKFIDPLVDFAFKKIFCSEPNKDLLIAFLNDIFGGHKQIIDLVYSKNEHPGDSADEGGAIFDLLCVGDKGEQFIIEVQRGKQENFKERTLFYTSRLISDQAPKGRRSDWAYNVTEIYLIAILEDFVLEDSPPDSYVHDVSLCYLSTRGIFNNKLRYTYIELPKFVKTAEELETDLDRWLYILKNMSSMDKIPVYLRKPIFEKLFNVAEYSKLTKEDKMLYDSSLKRKWDNKNVLDYAVKEAKIKGEIQGALETAIAIAAEMKKEGIPVEQIAKITKVSIAEIAKL